MSLHPRILAELDRRASLQNMTRAQLQENILWVALFPDEPNPKAFQAAAKAAFKQSKLAWLEARDTPEARIEAKREAKKEAVKQARIAAQKAKEEAKKAKIEARIQAKSAAKEARWQAKIDEAMTRWRAKWLRS